MIRNDREIIENVFQQVNTFEEFARLPEDKKLQFATSSLKHTLRAVQVVSKIFSCSVLDAANRPQDISDAIATLYRIPEEKAQLQYIVGLETVDTLARLAIQGSEGSDQQKSFFSVKRVLFNFQPNENSNRIHRNFFRHMYAVARIYARNLDAKEKSIYEVASASNRQISITMDVSPVSPDHQKILGTTEEMLEDSELFADLETFSPTSRAIAQELINGSSVTAMIKKYGQSAYDTARQDILQYILSSDTPEEVFLPFTGHPTRRALHTSSEKEIPAISTEHSLREIIAALMQVYNDRKLTTEEHQELLSLLHHWGIFKPEETERAFMQNQGIGTSLYLRYRQNALRKITTALQQLSAAKYSDLPSFSKLYELRTRPQRRQGKERIQIPKDIFHVIDQIRQLLPARWENSPHILLKLNIKNPLERALVTAILQAPAPENGTTFSDFLQSLGTPYEAFKHAHPTRPTKQLQRYMNAFLRDGVLLKLLSSPLEKPSNLVLQHMRAIYEMLELSSRNDLLFNLSSSQYHLWSDVDTFIKNHGYFWVSDFCRIFPNYNRRSLATHLKEIMENVRQTTSKVQPSRRQWKETWPTAG